MMHNPSIVTANNAGSMQVEVMDLNSDSKEAQRLHAETLRRFEAQRRARSIVVPTIVDEVKAKLRELGQPATLFGEGPGDRRERLREVIARLELDDEELRHMQTAMNQSSGASASLSGIPAAESLKISHKEVFYSPAPDSLVQFRRQVTPYSFQKAHERILKTKATREDEQLQAKEDAALLNKYVTCRGIILNSSQYGDDRPMTSVRYSPRGEFIATASLGGTVKVWDVSRLECLASRKQQEERVTAVAWHPQAFVTSRDGLLATSSADGSCLVWKCSVGGENGESMVVDHIEGNDSHGNTIEMSPAVKLTGHQGIVSSCDFHPMGGVVGTAGVDYSWRLWDVESGKEMQLQDGHSKECSGISFQQDGALVATVDWAGVVLVWDLRSGQQIAVFQGHVKRITSVHFSPDGYQIASGGMDNAVRIWDLRKRKCGYVLPAHGNVISDVRYSPSGEFLVSVSFDGSAKLWGTRDYRLLSSMQGHVGKVMSVDISADEAHVMTAGFDRTFKLWAHRDEF